MIYDLIIIGGGPAGLTAAIYSARYRMKTLVLSKQMGGLAATAHKVCNFPSYIEINGFELMNKFTEQVKALEIPIRYEEVKNVKKENNFIITTNKDKYFAKKVIFSGGTVRKELGVNGEKELLGKGVSYCATCDAAFFKDKEVAVIGGSNSALTSALILSEYAKQVHIIYRKNNFFRAEPSWTELVEKNEKIKVLFNEEVIEIMGGKSVEAIKLKSGKEVKLQGIFIEIGSIPNLNLLNSLDIKTEKGYIIADKNQKTNVPGFYAAGDITNNSFKQIVTASSEGAIATYNIYKEIKGEEEEKSQNDRLRMQKIPAR